MQIPNDERNWNQVEEIRKIIQRIRFSVLCVLLCPDIGQVLDNSLVDFNALKESGLIEVFVVIVQQDGRIPDGRKAKGGDPTLKMGGMRSFKKVVKISTHCSNVATVSPS